MNNIDWQFADTGGGDATGLNDPVTTTFKGDLSYHLARESIQNIIDAHDSRQKGPAIAVFDVIERQPDQLFLNDTYQKVLVGCRDFKKNKDAVRFYDSALFKAQHKNFIRVLRIRDYNTVGLIGEDEDNEGNYYQLMKGVGDSSKGGSKGGSFGLGKGAYYAASSFHTIFVSSMYGKDKYVFQGKARLSSYRDPKTNQIMQGNGCFGLLERQKPIRDPAMIPSSFRRDEMGTDFYVIGFAGEDKEWQKQMMESVLNNFWYTISKGHLEVTIGQETVNSSNLEKYMKEYFDETQPDKNKTPNPWPYYLAYTSSDHKVFEDTLSVLGKVKLYVLMKNDFPQRVVYIRQTGMVIQKKGIGSVNPYAAVFVCDDDDGNLILRKMENPEHNEWNKENAVGSEYAEKAINAEDELRDFVKKSLNALSESNMPITSRIGDLEEYLSLPGDQDIGSTSAGFSGKPIDKQSDTETGNFLNKTGEETRNSTPIIRTVSPVKEKITTGKSGGEFPIIENTGGGGGHGGGGGTEGKGNKKVIVLTNVKFRSFANRNSSGGITHVVILKGPKNKKCSLEIKAGTDDSFDTVNVVKAETGNNVPLNVKNTHIDGIQTDDRGEAKLYVKFASDDKYSLNITAYENK